MKDTNIHCNANKIFLCSACSRIIRGKAKTYNLTRFGFYLNEGLRNNIVASL
jgi:hypothetical protein